MSGGSAWDGGRVWATLTFVERPRRRALAPALVALGLTVAACSSPPPKQPAQTETVAVNSGLETSPSLPPMQEKNAKGGGDPSAMLAGLMPGAGAPGGGGGPTAGGGASAPEPKDGKDGKDGKDEKKKDDSPRASKQECERALDRGVEVEINAQAAQLRPILGDGGMAKMIQEQKQRNRKPDPKNPCNEKNEGITKNQFTCAMAAKTKPAWVKCMEN